MPTVAEVMTEDPIVVRPSDTFEHCADSMRLFDIRHLPVVTAADKLAGLIGDTDVFRHGWFDPEGQWVSNRPDLVGASIAGVVRPTASRPATIALLDLIRQLIEVEEDVVVLVDDQRVPVGIFTEYDALGLASRELPEEVSVDRWMARSLVTVDLGVPMAEAQDLMVEHSIRHLPVREGSRLVGLVSSRDLVWAGASIAGDGLLAQLVDLDRPLVTTTPEATLEAVARQLANLKIGCMPVLDPAGDLVGLVTVTDVLKAYAEVLA